MKKPKVGRSVYKRNDPDGVQRWLFVGVITQAIEDFPFFEYRETETGIFKLGHTDSSIWIE